MKVSSLQTNKDRAEIMVGHKFAPTSQDMAHAAKRTLALSGEDADEFKHAADIEGMTTAQLRSVILSKPDDIMAKENERRRIVLLIRQATSIAEIKSILATNGVPEISF